MNRILEMVENKVDVNELSPAALAYVGDVVYEIFVRTKLVLEKQRKLKELNNCAKEYVKASCQADAYKKIEEHLSEEELEIYKRGRNHSGNISSRSATVVDYRMATGFEALLGYLYLSGKHDRLCMLVKLVFDEKENL